MHIFFLFLFEKRKEEKKKGGGRRSHEFDLSLSKRAHLTWVDVELYPIAKTVCTNAAHQKAAPTCVLRLPQLRRFTLMVELPVPLSPVHVAPQAALPPLSLAPSHIIACFFGVASTRYSTRYVRSDNVYFGVRGAFSC